MKPEFLCQSTLVYAEHYCVPQGSICGPLIILNRSQGASVANMKPEYLFEPQDYQRWMKLQEHVREQKRAEQQGKSTIAIRVEEAPLDENLFQSVSKRAWTDLILQTLKVIRFVLIEQFKDCIHASIKSHLDKCDINNLEDAATKQQMSMPCHIS